MNMLHRPLEQPTQDTQSNSNDKEPFEATPAPAVSVGSFKPFLSQESSLLNGQPMCQVSTQIPPEEAKSISNKAQSVEDIVWEWQSDPDPLSSEPKQWKPCNTADNDLLEKAYQNKEGLVTLDEWVENVSDKHIFQQRRDNPFQQKPIRRMKIKVNGDMDHMKEETSEGQHLRRLRFIEGETPKTYTSAFGSLDDYLSFFENRTPEIASFAESLKKIESTKDLHILNQDIVPFVIKSIQTEAIKCNKEKQKKSLIKLLQTSFTSLKQLYGAILMAYTMETFLYKNLNKYLRNEDWTQLDDLLPYAFLVCKAFQCSELASTCNKYLQQSKEYQQHPPETLILYRGAHFDEELLGYYNSETISTFSWNAVTSTSTNPSVAEIFSELSDVPDKVPVIFEIEASVSNQLNLIDIKTLSESPEENEVVLPPGSIFELISSRRDQKRAQIKLRLISDTSELAFQGKIMHGAMHAQVSKGTVAKIICQQGKELTEALQHLKGNRMVEKIEFTLCKFDEKTAIMLAEVLITLPKLSKIVLASFYFDQDIHLKTMLKGLGKSKIRDIEVSDRLLGNDNKMASFMEGVRDMKWLSLLKFDFRKSRTLDDNHLKRIVDGGMRHLTSLIDLTLDFSGCKGITDEGMKSLSSEGLKHLNSLTTLTLEFCRCEQITDKGMKSLCSEGLKSLTSLETLKFRCWEKITDEGVRSLSLEGLQHLTSLRTLTLDFRCSEEITDEGMKSLGSEGLKHLTSLTTLTLTFRKGQQLIDKGVRNLSSEGLKHLTLLTTLTLVFDKCNIRDEGMKSLCSEGLKNLTSLTTLTLKFRRCSQITDEGVKSLSSEGLKHLISLTTLTLVFEECKIRDKGMKSLCSEGLKHLTLLTTLTLVFDKNIRDEGMKSLCSEGLKNLTSLTTLTLDFGWCDKIRDEGMKSLCSEGLKHLASLKVMTLNLKHCKQITNQGIRSLCSGLGYLTFLTDLTLDVQNCPKITDEGLNYLRAQCNTLNISMILSKTAEFSGSRGVFTLRRNLNLKGFTDSENQAASQSHSLEYFNPLGSCSNTSSFSTDYREKEKLQLLEKLEINYYELQDIVSAGLMKRLYSERFSHMISLINLTINFESWQKLTNEELKDLFSEGFRYLTSLITLNLSFKSCTTITDEEMGSLSEGLGHLISLTDLNLCFNSFKKCPTITDKGVKSLLEGFRHLTSLATLNLSFNVCTKITDEGMKSLSEGLRHLTSLTTLALKFKGCHEITDKGVNSLSLDGLKHQNSLRSLTLHFNGCYRITDEGVLSLCFDGLRFLSLLTRLNLDFREASFSESSLKEIEEFLKHFRFTSID